MKRTSGWSLIGVVALASTLGVSALQAQANPIAIGVVAGASIPTGDFGDNADTGWHAGGLLEWSSPAYPVGVRGDVVYHRFGAKGTSDSKLNILAATLNLVWMFPMEAPTVRPYLIGGGGYYHATCDGCGGNDNTRNKLGINGGGGLSVPLSGFSAFAEARFHHIFAKDEAKGETNANMIPISFGIMIHP
jgi:hypothetical protein